MSAFTEKFIKYAEKYSELISFTDDRSAMFETLAARLVAANEHVNLTAICDEDGIILRHFIDSMTILPCIGDAKELIDIGCGGGFPTLPVAICRPDVRITALDSTAKKLVFVDEIAKELSLNVQTLAARAEEYGQGDGREMYDLAMSRAVARLNVLCELCLPTVRVGGRFVALKGADGMGELDEAANGIKRLGGRVTGTKRLSLGDAGERVIIEIEKTEPTPRVYPRQFSAIKKRPL